MNEELLLRGRRRYVHLNKKFLEAVEKGAPWEELQLLLEEMRQLARYLRDLPATSVDPDRADQQDLYPGEARGTASNPAE